MNRFAELALALTCVGAFSGCVGVSESEAPTSVSEPVAVHASSASAELPEVEFGADVLPILQRECAPCHFEGGSMYAELPFDRPQTIVDLGERALARIDDTEDREVVRQFLDRQADPGF